jgi:hypothetical protein
MSYSGSVRPFRPRTNLPARSAIGLLVLLTATVAEAGAQGRRNTVPTQQAIAVNGSWSAWTNQANVSQTTSPAGGIATELTVESNTLGGPLMNLVSATLAGDMKAAQVQLGTYDMNRFAEVNSLILSGTRVQEIDLPALDASNPGAVAFTVKFSQAATEQGAGSGGMPQIGAAQVIQSNHFRLDVDGLSGSYVATVGPLVVTATEKGARFPPLVVTIRSGTNAMAQQQVAEWQQWFTSAQPRNGTLTFLDPTMRRAVLVERFSGLRVTGISTTAGVSTVTMAMTGMGIDAGK